MTRAKHLKGTCSHCRLPFEFPADSIGLTSQCPHCGQPTELLLAPPPADTSASRRLMAWTLVAGLVVAVGVIVPLVGLKFFQKKLAERRANQSVTTTTGSPPANGIPKKP
ncbi:MAG: hypothetical protein ABSF95_12980 [Verrucomicrobiota bacterium]|jgi:hypothetical protein